MLSVVPIKFVPSIVLGLPVRSHPPPPPSDEGSSHESVPEPSVLSKYPLVPSAAGNV